MKVFGDVEIVPNTPLKTMEDIDYSPPAQGKFRKNLSLNRRSNTATNSWTQFRDEQKNYMDNKEYLTGNFQSVQLQKSGLIK